MVVGEKDMSNSGKDGAAAVFPQQKVKGAELGKCDVSFVAEAYNCQCICTYRLCTDIQVSR